MLYRLLYRSRCVIPESLLDQELASIEWACERNNPRENVTGALIYHDGWFAQLLEGGRVAVSDTLKRLIHDPRHADVELMFVGEAQKREFTQFSMLVARADEWFAVEMADFTVGDRFDLATLSASSLAGFLVSVGNASSRKVKADLEMVAAFGAAR